MSIVICERCRGTGILTYDVDSHNSEYVDKTCSDCEGSGRQEEEVDISLKPFKPGKETTRIF